MPSSGNPSKNQGGDRGKGPNVTGTLPKKRGKAAAAKAGRKGVQAGPRKTPRGTTRRSGER